MEENNILEENQNLDNNDGAKNETPVIKKEKETTMAEIQAQIQQLMTENAKLKREKDRSSSEAADYKRKWKSTMSEVEQASQEKAEKEAEREERYKEMERELSINRMEKSFLAMNYTADEASLMAKAEVDNDFDAKIKIQAQVDARKKKEYEAEFLKNRPPVNAGIDDSTAVDPFLAGFKSVKISR